jgi:hypothetical protein
MALPLDVRKFFGHTMDFALRGDQHDAAKPASRVNRNCTGNTSRSALQFCVKGAMKTCTTSTVARTFCLLVTSC